MAAPHVAGAVALLWSAHPAYRNEITFTEQLLNQSAVHIPSTACSSSDWPNNSFGYGRLDVAAAVNAVIIATQTARPGEAVTYTLRITNTAPVTDTFTLLMGSHQWQTAIVPTMTAALVPSQSITATIVVSIPMSATANETDAVAIVAASSLTQTEWSFATLTTQAQPVYAVSLLPAQISQDILWERTVTYTLNLINTGQVTNTYTLSGTLSNWPFFIEPLSVTLASQISATVQASVTAPLTATYPASNTLRVMAFGTNAAAFSDLVTTIGLRQIFLPIILR